MCRGTMEEIFEANSQHLHLRDRTTVRGCRLLLPCLSLSRLKPPGISLTGNVWLILAFNITTSVTHLEAVNQPKRALKGHDRVVSPHARGTIPSQQKKTAE